jgi:hypothetical protein
MLSSHERMTTTTEAHRSTRRGPSATETRTSHVARTNHTTPDTHSGRDSRAQAGDRGSHKHTKTPHQTEGSGTRLQMTEETKRSAPQDSSGSGLGRQTHTPTVAGSISGNSKGSTVEEGLLTRSDVASSSEDSGKQALPSHLGGEADSEVQKAQSRRQPTASTTGSKLSSAEALLSSVDGKLDYPVQTRSTELPQCGEPLGTTGAKYETDGVEDSQHSASGEADEADVDTQTLGEQVI